MRIVPKGNMAVGRLVEVKKSRLAGVELPDSEKKNVSVLMVIDDVGPQFTKAKPGDLVIYLACRHVVLRDRSHASLVDDDNVLGLVEISDEERELLEFEKPTFDNGRATPAVLATA